MPVPQETRKLRPNLRHCFLALLHHERVDLEVSLLNMAALDDVTTSFALPLLHLWHRSGWVQNVHKQSGCCCGYRTRVCGMFLRYSDRVSRRGPALCPWCLLVCHIKSSTKHIRVIVCKDSRNCGPPLYQICSSSVSKPVQSERMRIVYQKEGVGAYIRSFFTRGTTVCP